jgi:2',3'-cyclic-nucleotide 2'-phosphodiesterase (5'-nucleotidase family)
LSDSIKIPDVRTLDILYTNDIQGEADQMIYLATKVKEIRALENYTILLDSGNWAKGTFLSDNFKGMPMVEIFNVMKYDAVNVGEGEIAFGSDNLYQLQQYAQFPLISCNLIENGTGAPPSYIKKYTVINRGPFNIAITGISSPDEQFHDSNLTSVNPFKILPEVIQELSSYEIDVFILLSRLGLERDRALSRVFPRFNVIIGGKDKKQLDQPIVEGQTFICQAGEKGKYIGSISIDMHSILKISESQR